MEPNVMPFGIEETYQVIAALIKGDDAFTFYVKEVQFLDKDAAKSVCDAFNCYVETYGPLPDGVTAEEAFRLIHPATSIEPGNDDETFRLLRELFN